ncbi:MAG: class I SAM-dependent methyltransferase [Syntrophaceae bacterium]|nr:class I SAM-dependent methyltransferase [Syntrophaceae bacterium]
MDSEVLYTQQWEALNRDPRGFELFREPLFESGDHPQNFIDHQCAFAAFHLRRARPERILDIGSYRHFILGLLAHSPVTTIDVRTRTPAVENETVITCDAKKLALPDDFFDSVVSLCALEHFGLGRYGDEFDPSADRKAFSEMVRVLRPGGRLIVTTTLTRARPSVVFNAHRIYSRSLLQSFTAGLTLAEERFYSHEKKGFCSFQEITDKPRWWDVYCGSWEKA